MIQSINYYNATPEQKIAQIQDFYNVIKGLGFRNTGEINDFISYYGVTPLVLDSVNVYVEKEPKYFLLSTERYRRSKRDGGKSVKIPIGTLINAPRIKRTVKEIIQIQKDRAAAELAKQNSAKVASEYAADLSEFMSAYGASAKAYSESIKVRVPAKSLSVDYLQRQGYSLHVNDTDMEFTVDRKTNKVLYIECEKSMPRIQSYGKNGRKDLEKVIQCAQEELNRLQVAEGLMDHYVQSLKIRETLEAQA